MKTQLILPTLAISEYVSGILAIENWNNINDFILPLYANGSPTIVFQTAKASKQNKSVGHLTLYGQTIRPDQLLIKEQFTLIAYFLHPHSLKYLFGINAAELTDKSIDLNSLKQARTINLEEQLLNQTMLKGRLQLINGFIQNLSAENKIDNKKIFFATNELKKNNGFHSLKEVHSTLNTSERSLQRLFESNVGISPKLYARVCQFQSAFQQLNQHQFKKLTDLAYENRFSDQSHFIRVFKEFTNITPKEYLTMSASYNAKF